MADTLALGASAVRHGGSSPLPRTYLILGWDQKLNILYKNKKGRWFLKPYTAFYTSIVGSMDTSVILRVGDTAKSVLDWHIRRGGEILDLSEYCRRNMLFLG